jgi:hypothetical protein
MDTETLRERLRREAAAPGTKNRAAAAQRSAAPAGRKAILDSRGRAGNAGRRNNCNANGH